MDIKKKTIGVHEAGVEFVEDQLGIDNLYDAQNSLLVSYLNNAIKVKELFERDKDYIVRNGEVLIVDEFTGRVLDGRRFNEGLHQAIEAKEGVEIKAENQTLATITLQNYFRMYDKLSGMTGTAQTEAAELDQIYKLGVLPIPTNKPMVRADQTDLIYKTEEAKFDAVVDDITERHEAGQPVLIGTTSVERSEYLSRQLAKRGIEHNVLNAKFHEQEAQIIAEAGRSGAVTVATNMAGRGTDVVLGGNPDIIADTRCASSVWTRWRRRTSTRPRGTRSSRPSVRRSPPTPTRSASRAGSTSSAPNDTSRVVSTTSCAAGRVVRATPVSRASTCRSVTSSCAGSTVPHSRRS